MNDPAKSETEFVVNTYSNEYEGEKMAARLNEAIGERNARVEEYLNVQIEERLIQEDSRPGGTMLTTVRNEIIAGGSTDYHVVTPCLYDCATLAAENSFVNLLSIRRSICPIPGGIRALTATCRLPASCILQTAT